MKDLRNLPTEVLVRLEQLISEDAPGEGVRLGVDVRRGSQLVNARLFQPEVRTDDETEERTVDGYATVWEHPYDVAGGPPYGWTETIARGAATKSLQEQDNVGLLVNHDSDTSFGLPLAANWAGTLDLEADDTGLRMEARVAPGDVVSDFLIRRLERGEADSMSFAFRVLKQAWNDDYTEREIQELGLVDVSVVNYPANPATLALLRADRLAKNEQRSSNLDYFAAVAEATRLRG